MDKQQFMLDFERELSHTVQRLCIKINLLESTDDRITRQILTVSFFFPPTKEQKLIAETPYEFGLNMQ